MLVTRPFTNEEVAARLELGCLDPGMIAEACRRLRGLPGSGCKSTERTVLFEDGCTAPLPTIEPHLLEVGK